MSAETFQPRRVRMTVWHGGVAGALILAAGASSPPDHAITVVIITASATVCAATITACVPLVKDWALRRRKPVDHNAEELVELRSFVDHLLDELTDLRTENKAQAAQIKRLLRRRDG